MAGLDDLVGGAGSLKTPELGGAAGGGSTNAELMAEARAALSGNWGLAVLGNVLYVLLMNAIGFFAFAACFFVVAASAVSGGDAAAGFNAVYAVAYLFLFLVSGPAIVGVCGFFLGIAQGDAPRLEHLFVGFRRFGKSLGAYFFFLLFYLLWYLLFIIPGLIALFRYAMTFFVIADDESCGPLEAIRRSKEMMVGHKWKFFCLNFRFLGWMILANLTGGIGYLWLIPYMQTSFAKFYEDVN